MRLPAPQHTFDVPDDFRAAQERRLIRAEVSDYCGAVRFRNFKRLIGAVSLLVITIVASIAAIEGHGVLDLIVHLFV